MDYFMYVLIAFIIACIIFVIRPSKSKFDSNEKNIISGSIGWVLVVYALILSFSINIFYSRYVEIRNVFIADASNLHLIYRYLKRSPNSAYPIFKILEYSQYVSTYLTKNLRHQEFGANVSRLYFEMNNAIIEYVQENPNVIFSNNMLFRINTDQIIIQLTHEIKISSHYLNILWFLFFFVVVLIYFITTSNKLIQFFIDGILLTILLSGIYLCTILSNPFLESPVNINFAAYQDLVREITSSS
jgi:hypothetical protein